MNKALPKNPDSFPFFVLANKGDREAERAVSRARYKEWSDRFNVRVDEVNAVDGNNIDKVFDRIARTLLEHAILHLRLEPRKRHYRRDI